MLSVGFRIGSWSVCWSIRCKKCTTWKVGRARRSGAWGKRREDPAIDEKERARYNLPCLKTTRSTAGGFTAPAVVELVEAQNHSHYSREAKVTSGSRSERRFEEGNHGRVYFGSPKKGDPG
jgi:hypothetical protein